MNQRQTSWKIGWRAAKAIKARVTIYIDYWRYRRTLLTYLSRLEPGNVSAGNALFIAGRGMNVTWGQVWVYLALALSLKGIKPNVLLMKGQRWLRFYFRLIGARIFYIEDCLATATPSFDTKRLDDCHSVEEWKRLYHNNMPIGQMALSTYSRHYSTGFIDPSRADFRPFAAEWIANICRAYDAALNLYRAQGITTAIFTETFIEEYGGFYYAALAAGLDIIKTSGTVRDNAIVVQRRSATNERLHHAALTEPAWQEVLKLNDYPHIRALVEQNFADRYGDKWLRSKRNHRNTRLVSREEGRARLGLPEERKVVIVFSHILYDCLFHYGDELFQDYAVWLTETVKLAVKNDKVEWFIKLHPSNLWRGEFESVLGGRYEEERIIDQTVGDLPRHVHLIRADTELNPLSWYRIADFGISVRGTPGLEMACLGKPVITAGTGRYEGKGFTIDPASIDEYRSILLRLPDVPAMTPEQIERAMRYAHGLFNMKPFVLESLKPMLRFGKREVRESDDIAYIPQPHQPGDPLPAELTRFADYIADRRQTDLLTAV